jgi:DNA repair exonuclease SbcCD ATPase subunit
MDEPFHDLDEQTKTNLVSLLEKLKEKRTIIIISSENIFPEFYDSTIELKPASKKYSEISN